MYTQQKEEKKGEGRRLERRRRKDKKDEGRGGEGEREKWREEKIISSNNKVFSPCLSPCSRLFPTEEL